MDLSRKPGGKYFRNRKDELQVEKELEAIKRRALLAHYQGKIQDFPDVPRPSAVEYFLPTPPTQPKPDSDRLKKTTKSMGKVDANATKMPQDGVSERKKASTQKITMDNLQHFKFAITSSLETTGPVPFREREKMKWKGFKPEATALSRQVRGRQKASSNAPVKSDRVIRSPRKAKPPLQHFTIHKPTPPPTPPKSTSISAFMSSSSTQSFGMGSTSSDTLMEHGVSPSPQSHGRPPLYSVTSVALSEVLPSFHAITPPFCLSISPPSLTPLTNSSDTQFHHNTASPLQSHWLSESIYLPNIASDASYMQDGNRSSVSLDTNPTMPSQEATPQQMLTGEDLPSVRTTPSLGSSSSLSGDDGKNEGGDEESGEDDEGMVGEEREIGSVEMSDLSPLMRYEDDNNFDSANVSTDFESEPSGNERESNQRMQWHSGEEESGSSDQEWRKEHLVCSTVGSLVPGCGKCLDRMERKARMSPEAGNLILQDLGSYNSLHGESPTSSGSHGSEYDGRKSSTLESHVSSSSRSTIVPSHQSRVCSEDDSRNLITEKISRVTVVRDDLGLQPAHDPYLNNFGQVQNSFEKDSLQLTRLPLQLKSGKISSSEASSRSELAPSRSEPGVTSSVAPGPSLSGVVTSSSEELHRRSEPSATVQSLRDHVVVITSDRILPKSAALTTQEGVSTAITSHRFSPLYPDSSISTAYPNSSALAHPHMEGEVSGGEGEVWCADGVAAVEPTRAAETCDMARVLDSLLQGNQSIPQSTLAEFLAFSDGPVKMEDILMLVGRKAPIFTKSGKKDNHQQEDFSSIRPSSDANISLKLPKPIFLSTWRGPTVPGHSIPHHSIHHFCTEFHSPQLTPQMKILSILTHANRNPDLTRAYLREMAEAIVEQDTGGEGRMDGGLDVVEGQDDQKDLSGEVGVDGGEKRVVNVYYDRLNAFEGRWGFDRENTLRGDSDMKATPHFRVKSSASKTPPLTRTTGKRRARSVGPSAHRSSGYQTVPHRSVLENVDCTTDALMDTARAKLRKESRGNRRMSLCSKLPVAGVGNKSPMSVQVLATTGVEEGGGGRRGRAVKKMAVDDKDHLPGSLKDDATERGTCPTLLKAGVMKATSLLWSLAPPKLSLPPCVIQACLFPDYIPYQAKSTSPGRTNWSEVDTRTEEKGVEKDESLPSTKMVCGSSLLLPAQHSLHQPSSEADVQVVMTTSSYTKETTPAGDQAEERMPSVTLNVPDLSVMNVAMHVLPGMPCQEDRSQDHQFGADDFKTIMKQIQTQKEQLLLIVSQKKYAEKEICLPRRHTISLKRVDVLITRPCSSSPMRLKGRSLKTRRKTVTEYSAHRSWSRAASRTRGIKKTSSVQMRIQYAREHIFQPRRPLISYRRSPRLSVPAIREEHFPSLMLMLGGDPSTDNHYKWAYKQWWDVWFPEVLEESNNEVSKIYSIAKVAPWLSTGLQSTTPNKPSKSGATSRKLLKFRMISRRRLREKQEEEEEERKKEEEGKKEKEVVKEGFWELEDVEPIVDTAQVENLELEVKHIGELLEKSEDCDGDDVVGMVAAYYCRRGSLLRKLGRLPESLADLNKSILLQPLQEDAYWSRHLLFLIQGNDDAALEDLSYLLKRCKTHYKGYWSKAVLLAKKGDLDNAMFALNHAIALHPHDPDLYFLRAELYEKHGEMGLAMADYDHTSRLDLTSIEPIRRQAMHKFNKRMFGSASQLFTDLLQRDPSNSEARIYRAKSLWHFKQYEKALQDLSTTIHLDPNNSSAFYLRGSLLRTKYPQQALKDFSVSLLLDNSVKNVSAYVHRGVLYAHLKCYSEALRDFEAAMKLDHSLLSPHMCGGLIYLMHRKNLPKAIHCFSCAINIDPTCLKAYLCRAEAYKREEKYELAALDYTKVIHLEPNNPVNYLYKGEVYLLLKDYKIASFHIETASNLTTGSSQSIAQSALIESFLGNHDRAITILSSLPNTPEVSVLLGKAQHRAKKFDEAAESFKHSLQLMNIANNARKSMASPKMFQFSLVPNITKLSDVNSQGAIHFLCGKSQVEGGAIKEAIHQFGRVLELLPNHAKAYYERGRAKMKLGLSHKGLLDVNKSLAINPYFFEAYLARAALFGQAGRYTKAILNCNEAIQISPSSVRAYLCRGSLKYLIRFYSGAIEDLNKAIQLDHAHSSLAHFNRGLCYQAVHKPIMALADYSTVLLLGEKLNLKVFINRGLLYLHLQDYNNAILDLQDAGKLVPDDSSAIFQAVGYCYHQLGVLDSSIQAYSEAISLDHSHLEAYVGRGNAYMEYLMEEANVLAKADYLHVLDVNSSHLQARVNLAFLLQREGKFQEAWDDLTTALTIDGMYVPALEARAIINLQMTNYFGALMDLTKALEVGKTATLYTNRGVVNQYMGDIYSASTDYQSALRLNPKHSLAHFNLGNLEFHQRLFSHAITSYTSALSCAAQVDDSILVNRAIAYAMMREVDKALCDFEDSMEVNPFSAPAYFNRGNLYKSIGKYENAMQDYKRALELQPEDWLTLYYYGEMQGLQGDREAAIQTFHKAARLEIP